MVWQNTSKLVSLLLPIIIGIFIFFSLTTTQLHQDSKIMSLIFCTMSFLLLLNSISCIIPLGTIGYFLSSTAIVLSPNFFTMICTWESASVTAILVLLSNRNNDKGHILRYASIHFISGTLIIASVPFDLMFMDINSVVTQLEQHNVIFLMTGILINCASFPLSTWVTDAYPKASPHGTAFLQLFVTKSSIFMLFILFSGYKILTIIGFITALYAFIYSLWENKLRTILTYNTVGQMGLLTVSIGFGADIIPYLIASIIYQSIMYMAASSIIHATGKENIKELGGLFKKIPILGLFCIIALITMSAFPFTISLSAKHIMLESIKPSTPLILFLVISYGLIISCGIRPIYFTFFHKQDYLDNIRKIPWNSTLALLASTILCFIPLVDVENTYLLSEVLKNLILFTSVYGIFYCLRFMWYNTEYKLVEVDCVYRVYIKRLLCWLESRILVLWKKVYCFCKTKLIIALKRLDEITLEAISYTVLSAIVIIMVLVGLYV